MQSITGFAISKAYMPCKLVVLHPNKCADMPASSFTSATVPISIFNVPPSFICQQLYDDAIGLQYPRILYALYFLMHYFY